MSALKGVQSLTRTQEHARNDRPKVRIICERSEGVQSLTETQEHAMNYRPKVRTNCERSEGGPVSHRDTGTCQELKTKGQDYLLAL